MVKIQGKIFKLGNSYAILVKKALIDSEVLIEGHNYEWELKTHQDAHKTPDNAYFRLLSGNPVGMGVAW